MNETRGTRHTKVTLAEQAAMVSSYKLGKTVRRIMVETGRSYGAVYGALQRAKVTMRRRGKEANQPGKWWRDNV